MLKAIIFDFDGVITDSEPVHLKMFQKVLSEKGISLGVEEYYERYLGMDDRGCFSALLEAHGVEPDRELIQSLVRKKTTYLMEYIKNDLFIYPGVVDFVEKARDRFHLAIASGALRHEIEFVLRRAGIDSAFEVIVSAEDVQAGKPDPECFLKALKRLNETFMGQGLTEEDEEPLTLTLYPQKRGKGEGRSSGGIEGISPEECLVIEDSIAGIEGAIAAGMKCIAVTNTYGPERLTMANLVVKSLEEIDLDTLEGL